MKLNITIDGKTYEVDVEAAEPEAPAAPPYNVSGLNLGSAPVRVPAASAAPPAETRLGKRREGLPQPGFGHCGAGGRPGGAEPAAGRYSAGAGSHEDGNEYHGPLGRQGRRHSRESGRQRAGRARWWWSSNNVTNWNRYRDFCFSIMWPFR